MDASVCLCECSFVAEPTMMIFYNQQELCSYHSERERVIECFFGVIFYFIFKDESVSNSKREKCVLYPKSETKF